MAITNGYCTLLEAKQHILNQANYTATTISFTNSGSLISDTAYGLDEFLEEMTIQVSGSTSNDGYYTVATAGVGSIAVSESISDEAAGDTIIIQVVSGKFEDAELEAAIEAASRDIDDQTGRTFFGNTATRYYVVGEDTEGSTLTLDRALLSVTTLTNGDGSTLTENTHFVLLPLNEDAKHEIYLVPSGLKQWSYTSDPYTDTVSVLGSWGDASSAPANIKQACLLRAAWLYKRKDAVYGVQGTTQLGQITMRMPSDSDFWSLIAPYKRYL